MAVTDREMTSTTHAAFLPTIWSKDTRDAIEHEMVISSPNIVNTKYESEMAIGRTLQIPIRANYDTQTKTEGISGTTYDINFQSMPGTTGSGTNYQSITVSTFQYAAALLNAVVAAQSNYEERQAIAHGLGYSLNRGIEVTVAALYQSFSQIVGTLGAEPDDAVLRAAWNYLADVSSEDAASWLLSPGMTAGLFGVDKFTSGDFVGKKVIETARLPMMYGFPAYNARLLRAPATGQAEGALLHKEAVILIRQVMPTVRQQFLIRKLADGIVAFDLYNASEAIWSAEAPTTDADPTVGDYGAVLIRGN